MKTILVTGASGFSGLPLCYRLLQEGYFVLGASLSKTPIQHPNFESVYLNITDAVNVQTIIRKTRPDILIHLAAQSIPTLATKKPDETYRTNVTGTQNLLEAVSRYNPKTKFIFISTHQVYGHAFSIVNAADEKTTPCPTNPYALSKFLAEMICFQFYKEKKIPITIARPVNLVGPGLSQMLVFSDWSKQIAEAEKGTAKTMILRVGNIHVERDFLSVEDAVEAYLILIKRGKSGEVYNVASGKTKSLKSYLNDLQTMTPLKIKVIAEKARMRHHDITRTKSSVRKLKKLGWIPQKSVSSSLQSLLNDWREKLSAHD